MIDLELLSQPAQGSAKAAPILLLHGAWHGAWCWQENFMPYFAAHGYDVYAMSLRAHGQSGSDKALNWLRGADYVADVAQIVSSIQPAPVLIGHSLGGYVVQKYLEQHMLPAAVLLASLPSYGSLPFTLRTLLRQPLDLLRAALQMNLYPLVDSPAKTRRMFFSDSFPEEQVQAHYDRLIGESFLLALDCGILAVPRPRRVRTPLLVLGGELDYIFPPGEVEATARAYGTHAKIFPNMAHNLMQEQGWERVADHILAWLSAQGL
ncbi:MAG: alpha/beta hydrolase [Anaerolineae bacterium]|nr:alpha/beta hydrolase [Anaerolineae bacterium]